MKAAPSGKPARPQSTTLAIAEAARGVFLRVGFENASMDAIARQADVSKATLYAHFESKDALFFAMMQEEVAQYERQLAGLAAEKNGDVAERLARVGATLLTFMLTPSTMQMFRLVIAESSRIPEICQSAISAGRQRSRQTVAEIFRNGVEAGLLKPHDSEEAAKLFLAMLKGDLPWDCLINPRRRPTQPQIVAHIDNLVSHMIALYAVNGLDKPYRVT
jgi:AcrR family transcriptional regulator